MFFWRRVAPLIPEEGLKPTATPGYMRNFRDLNDQVSRGKSFSGYERNALFLNRAGNGFSDICKLILKYVDEKNPKSDIGNTPLHYAAKYGHLKICKLIQSNLKNKNPEDLNGLTPHSLAIQHVNKLFEINSDPEKPEDVPGPSGEQRRTTRKRAAKD